jgi:hypothetical protein
VDEGVADGVTVMVVVDGAACVEVGEGDALG